MLYLTNKDARLAGFATKECPTMWYGIRAGRLHVRVTLTGDKAAFAYCELCGWSGDTKHTLTSAQKSGANHAETCGK